MDSGVKESNPENADYHQCLLILSKMLEKMNSKLGISRLMTESKQL